MNSCERPNSGSDQTEDLTEDLVDRIHSAGLPVTLTVTGWRRVLPTAVDRVAYRIVEEALGNIARDADRTATTPVHIGYNPGELVVQVEDDGQVDRRTTVTPADRLIGMRERVTALGGRIHAESRPYGGFTVRAELPVPDLS